MKIEKDFLFDVPEGVKRLHIAVLVNESDHGSSVGNNQEQGSETLITVNVNPTK